MWAPGLRRKVGGGRLPSTAALCRVWVLDLGLSVLLTGGGRGPSEAPFWLPGHLWGEVCLGEVGGTALESCTLAALCPNPSHMELESDGVQ